ncbi:DNA cytosine methyltransferase [Deinococcus budaensis]|uniref:DNA (cytosine-5-)-methyltransferase n=1 Tax=Deinococcus budaensis TaxID=1665626 RepID=A0A7W8GJ76_9DEIO|nr:DNA cytosine methyltransferase [Deinococcus budaensis]MBB5236294.1 DNA (cytosine-5)-methyltransferase 1 [Deinococcus budaensis]
MAFSSVELFVGAGGLAQGLARAEFHPRLVAEWNPQACQTIHENQARGFQLVRDWPVVEGDVRDLSFGHLEGVDLVSGGPPCQPFSMGGKHTAHTDTRDMFPQAVRAVREARPRVFIFENVKGLTRPTFRNYFEYIRLQLQYPELIAREGEDWAEHLARLEQHHLSGHREGLTYRVVTQVLQAADFGVPQKRERVFFVGFRRDLGIDWHFPLPTHSREQLLHDQHVTGVYWERHGLPRPRVMARGVRRPPPQVQGPLLLAAPTPQPWQTVRDALQDLPDPELEGQGRFEDHRFIPGARSYPGHTGSPFDEPSKTLKAGDHGVPGGENMLLKPDGSVRYFTVRESARLQTFDDDYVFSGAWGHVMRQLGNAVPVRLAEVVARSVAQALPPRPA